MPEMRCLDVVPAGSDKLRAAPTNVAAPPGTLETPAGYVDYWYVSPKYELHLCRYEVAKPACSDNMSGATFGREENSWVHKESYELVCDD